MYDLIFDNARLCDGTGAASVLGSLAVEDGRIVAMGRLGGAAARRRIDAEGRVLAPGFIDPHTHYDAQLAWDPLATCSPLHGVTTIVFGNCGVGVAPVRPEMRERVMQDLVGVEGIPIDVMRQGIDWRWETWGEYLDVLDASGLGVNVAGLLAYTPLRHYVMGEASLERAATRPEIDAMTALFRSAMADGAFGFSTSVSQTHAGEGGRPVACRNASRAELAAMSRVLREFDRGVVGVALDSAGWNLISDDELELLRVLAGESGKRVTFLSMLSRPQEPDFHDRTFAKLETLGRSRRRSCRRRRRGRSSPSATCARRRSLPCTRASRRRSATTRNGRRRRPPARSSAGTSRARASARADRARRSAEATARATHS